MTSPAFLLYRAATALFAPFAGRFLAARAAKGKEDGSRIGERMGVAGAARPQGPLVWLHGASIGESLALLPLVQALIERGAHALVTTGTASSARVVGARLPAGAVHQFLPLDCGRFVKRFLGHWRPDLALFAESELWPNMIAAAHAQKIPVALVNARMSARSFDRWRMAPGAAGELMGMIDAVFAQSQIDAARFARLGARDAQVAGNLKYDVAAPPAAPDALAELVAQIGPRPVWIAASTHPGEEEMCVDAHMMLRGRAPDLLTVIVPRDARRGAEVAALAASQGARVARRGESARIADDTQVYVADTFGELGLWYRLAGVVFMGKSLVPGGGQNPIEPAKLGAAVLHGPSIENFAEAYAALEAAGAAVRVADTEELARALDALFSNGAKARSMARAAARTVEELSGATLKIVRAVEPYLAEKRATAQS